jgi:uncharacterized FAD-dependent dehydrogenase
MTTNEMKDKKMIKLSNIKIPASSGHSFTGEKGLKAAAAGLLGISEASINSLAILKRSVDARHKGDVCFVYTAVLSVDDEAGILKAKSTIASPYLPQEAYAFPYSDIKTAHRPVVVGAGPAGLFAALCLAEAGLKPVLIERGKPVESRMADVELFWKTGVLDVRSNVQFGEGGAGTFSDGKLTTGINDARIPFVLGRFVDYGAPEDIQYLAKPHIGTDRLRGVVVTMRRELLKLGCDIRFGHRLDGLRFENGRLTAAEIVSEDGAYTVETEYLILAPGNSARDTFEMLERAGVRLSAKSFSVGVRIEHLQKDIDMAQYGQAATLGTLPAADYKLAVHLKNGRSVYTFCVCPGGRIIAASSEEGQVVTNGMSEYARHEKNCNGGLLVSVTPEDYLGMNDAKLPSDALSGIAFQRALETSAFVHGGGNYNAPVQLVGDFLARRPSTGGLRPSQDAYRPSTGNVSPLKKAASVSPTYQPGVLWCNLWDVLPAFVCEALAEALPQMEKSIRGFSNPDAVLTAVETRSSSPVRIDREAYEAADLRGLFPCGEGSGYAGGIMSAAVDGIRAAEALCASIM